MKQARYKEPLSLAVIEAARAGDAGAVEQVLQYYNGYINKLCTRTLYDDCGQLHVCVDEYMKHRLENKLIYAMSVTADSKAPGAAAMWPPVSGVFSYASCCQYLFRWRSASLRRRIRLAQAAQYLARLDFGWNVAPHSQQRFTSSRSLMISAYRAASNGRTAA